MKNTMKVPYFGRGVNAHHFLTILLFFFSQPFVFGQFTEYNTGQYEDVWNDVVVDSEGFIYAVGTYTNKTTIDGNNLDNGISVGLNRTQLMVAKYDPNGIIQWITYGIAPCTFPGKGWSTGTRITIGEETGHVFIAGDHAGMKLVNGSNTYTIDELPSDYADPITTACLGNDNFSEPYIISLNMSSGAFLDYTKILRGTVTSMVVANDGSYNNHLYASLYNPVDKNAFIYRLPPALIPTGVNDLIQTTSTGIDHIINDIKYKKGKIYCLGTTVGNVQFGGLSLSISLPSGGKTAWAAIVNNPSGSISVLTMNHAGTGGKISGDQIYLDSSGNIIIAGLFTGTLVNPFNSSQTYGSALKNAYLMRLDQNTLIANDAIQTIEPPTSQYDVNHISLCGSDNTVFASITYTGKFLFFNPSGSVLNLTSPITINNSSKIAVASYTILPSMNNVWRNSTYGIGSDLGYEKANAVFEDQIYSVGNLFERMYFDYLPTFNTTISSTSPSKKAMIIRNDDSFSGVFKSYDGKVDILDEIKIAVYPNPNNGSFYIKGVSENDPIELFDVMGKRLEFSLSYSKDKAYIEVKNNVEIVIVKVNNTAYQVLINE